MAGKERGSCRQFGRRDFLRISSLAAVTAAAKLCAPTRVVAEEPSIDGVGLVSRADRYLPLWVEEGFSHLEFPKNWRDIAIISNSFEIDSNILVSLLITESPSGIKTSYMGAEGPFQIMPATRLQLINEIDCSVRLSIKKNVLDIKTGDLKDPGIFSGEVFLACVYLEEAGVPKGRIEKEASDYREKLEEIRRAAILYHDGLYSNPSFPSQYGRLEGERVVGILELLKGSRTFEDISPGLANFLAMKKFDF